MDSPTQLVFYDLAIIFASRSLLTFVLGSKISSLEYSKKKNFDFSSTCIFASILTYSTSTSSSFILPTSRCLKLKILFR